MASENFFFCPNGLVPETIQRELTSAISLNGWTATAKPTVPIQRKFKVTIHGLYWYLNSDGSYDVVTNKLVNAKLLEEFYERHETWKPFTWNHPHRGQLTVRFAAPVMVPAATANSGGLVAPFEINLIQHNPSYADDVSIPPVFAVPQNTALPVITGTIVVGQIVSASTGSWNNMPTSSYSYQWYADGVAIPGAVGPTLLLSSGQTANKMLTIRVTATNALGSTPATSAAVGPVSP